MISRSCFLLLLIPPSCSCFPGLPCSHLLRVCIQYMHESHTCACVLQLRQTCACCPWMREAVESTLCAGTLTVRFKPAGPSSTAAVTETTTVSFTRRSVKRRVSGRLKVQIETQTHYFKLCV